MKCTINGSKRSQPKISGNNRKVFSIGSQKIGSSKKNIAVILPGLLCCHSIMDFLVEKTVTLQD